MFLSTINLSYSADKMWIKGFGPVNFGDKCKSKNKDFEKFEHQDFIIEAQCVFKYMNKKNSIITFIKISTNSLSLESAKKLIMSKIPKGFKFWDKEPIGLPNVKGAILIHPTNAFGKTNLECKNSLDIKNSIEIREYPTLPKYSEEIKVGKLHILIYANQLRCLERKKIIRAINNNTKLKFNKEINSKVGNSFLNNLK